MKSETKITTSIHTYPFPTPRIVLQSAPFLAGGGMWGYVGRGWKTGRDISAAGGGTGRTPVGARGGMVPDITGGGGIAGGAFAAGGAAAAARTRGGNGRGG